MKTHRSAFALKTAIAWALVLLFSGAAYEAGIAYFSRTRDLSATVPQRQNYFVLDADVWKFARPDLADVRIYDGQAQVPFALITQSGGGSSQESVARILNLGRVGEHTEFDLDVGELNEYGRVRLQIDARNFINTAQVEGRKTSSERPGVHLGSSTLYDFTAEGLGSNFVLRFPTSSFPYLHVRLAPGIAPAQIKGAYISNFSETKAAWSSSGTCSAAAGTPKQSIFECVLSDGMPAERVSFEVGSSPVNFNRAVTVSDQKGNDLERGSISRVRINRAGQSVTSEHLAIDLNSRITNQLKITVENGDDPPLPISRVEPLSIQRRLYFDPAGKPAFHVYYGDEKLEAPSYDYGKFFQQSADAAIAQLAPAAANPQFTGRPDDRPWSERHKILLWLAMLLAVGLLGGLALRGLNPNANSASPP